MSFRPEPPEREFHPVIERLLDRVGERVSAQDHEDYLRVVEQLDAMQARAAAEREEAERKTTKQMDLFG